MGSPETSACGKLVALIMVSFYVSAWLGPGGTQTFGQTTSWVSVWGCLWMRLTPESVDWVKWIALPSAVQSVEDPNRTKRLSKREFPWPECWAETWVLSCPWAGTYPIGSAGSQAFRLGLDHSIGPPGSPACRPQMLEFVTLINHVNHSL